MGLFFVSVGKYVVKVETGNLEEMELSQKWVVFRLFQRFWRVFVYWKSDGILYMLCNQRRGLGDILHRLGEFYSKAYKRQTSAVLGCHIGLQRPLNQAVQGNLLGRRRYGRPFMQFR